MCEGTHRHWTPPAIPWAIMSVIRKALPCSQRSHLECIFSSLHNPYYDYNILIPDTWLPVALKCINASHPGVRISAPVLTSSQMVTVTLAPALTSSQTLSLAVTATSAPALRHLAMTVTTALPHFHLSLTDCQVIIQVIHKCLTLLTTVIFASWGQLDFFTHSSGRSVTCHFWDQLQEDYNSIFL